MYRDRIESKAKGRAAVKGNAVALFFTGVLIALPASIVTGIFSGIQGAFDSSSATYGVLGALSGIFSAIVWVFMMPFEAGLAAKYLTVSRGGTTRDETVFRYYRTKDWIEKIKAYALIAIYVVLGTICFVVPGIIIAIRYSTIGFVFADNPGIYYRDAMDKCVDMTRGRKWEIFVFHLSFIGWHLLAALTFGILEIWVAPYQATAFAAYYDRIRPVDTTHSSDGEDIPVVEGPIYTDFDKAEDDTRF